MDLSKKIIGKKVLGFQNLMVWLQSIYCLTKLIVLKKKDPKVYKIFCGLIIFVQI